MLIEPKLYRVSFRIHITLTYLRKKFVSPAFSSLTVIVMDDRQKRVDSFHLKSPIDYDLGDLRARELRERNLACAASRSFVTL